MSGKTEIDKAGRLIVPKKLREALHLVPGTPMTIRQEGGAIVMEPRRKGRGLYFKNGIPVYEFGHPLPADCVDWLDQAREERTEELMGQWRKS